MGGDGGVNGTYLLVFTGVLTGASISFNGFSESLVSGFKGGL